jgi:hypothetical protein
MLGISLFRMYWRISELTVKTLLMEVFTASTPTSSGNYKAILETLPVEYECDTPEGFLAVERNAKRLSSLNIRGSK